ncbi:hypothetical protein AFERRI_400465 [Acidithiobacillus ferrivorans]|nr:hypothetical protein AFERRI_400465 [Acidithiobacillus ferrivorans]
MTHKDATEHLVVVINENTLGYMTNRTRDWFSTAGVLAGNIFKGGADWKNGPISVLPTDQVRPATLKDFEAFRVSPRGYRLQSTA